jgi:uncharacterized membrane protein
MSMGIIAAFVAMAAWGIGDFFIQRSTRKIGDWETLFLITFFGCLVLLPFVYKDIPTVLSLGTKNILILVVAGIALFVAALLEFEGLKEGKISVIEPTWSLEIPTAVLLSALVINERLAFSHILLIITLIVGLFLVSYKGTISKKLFFEKGVKISILAALIMGSANFFVGLGARQTDPLMINFIISLFSCVGSFIFLAARGSIAIPFRHLYNYSSMAAPMIVLDNIAWVAFALAMTQAPIGITVALSESYIVIAVILGIFVNKEGLTKRQYAGLCIAILSAIVLGTLTL